MKRVYITTHAYSRIRFRPWVLTRSSLHGADGRYLKHKVSPYVDRGFESASTALTGIFLVEMLKTGGRRPEARFSGSPREAQRSLLWHVASRRATSYHKVFYVAGSLIQERLKTEHERAHVHVVEIRVSCVEWLSSNDIGIADVIGLSRVYLIGIRSCCVAWVNCRGWACVIIYPAKYLGLS